MKALRLRLICPNALLHIGSGRNGSFQIILGPNPPGFPATMKKPTFTDRAGCTWTFQDYRVADDGPQPVELNDRSGEYRAFIALDGETRLVYRFGALSYRTTEPNV